MATVATRSVSPVRMRGRSPRRRLLRLQSDERLVDLVREGDDRAFDALVGRYHKQLLSFCRHMTGSPEDAEDVLQEVFAGGYSAMCADDRRIHVRPWLYRIARNACLKHLRSARAQKAPPVDGLYPLDGYDEVHVARARTTEDEVALREDVRLLVGDMLALPESQRTALVLWAVEARSYEKTAEVMETSVASVKSLLVRARLGLAEAAEARELTCETVELQLAEAAQGIGRASRAVRQHVKGCERCQAVDRRLTATSRALAALSPGPLAVLAHGLLAKLGLAAHGSTASAGATAATGAAAGAATGVGGAGAATAVSSGVTALAAKAAAGFAAATLLTAGTVEVSHLQGRDRARPASPQSHPAVAAEPSTPVPAPARSAPRHGASRAASPDAIRRARALQRQRSAVERQQRSAANTAPAASTPAKPQQRRTSAPATSSPPPTTTPQDTGSRRERPNPESTSGVSRGRPQPAPTSPDPTSSTAPSTGGN